MTTAPQLHPGPAARLIAPLLVLVGREVCCAVLREPQHAEGA